MNREEKEWLRFRTITLLAFFMVLYIALTARSFQLSILSSHELANLANMQYKRANDTKVLIRDLQKDINTFNALSPSYDILKKHVERTTDFLLSTERGKLSREVNELRSQHHKLSKEILSLQDNLKSLSKLEEDSVQRMVDAYDRIHERSKWFDFSVNFLMGIFTSVLGAIIYKLLALRYDLPLADIFNQFIRRILPGSTRPKT